MAVLTDVNLCRVDINNRYEHSIYFKDGVEQLNYFQSKVHLQSNSYTQIRREYDLQVSFAYERVMNCNYVYFYQNGKWWYYFINAIEYKNEGSTTLKLELDVIQTYMFDWSLPPCFIERQHTTSDDLYEHTIDEGLECGELITASKKDTGMWQELCCLVFSTINPEKSRNGTKTIDGKYNLGGLFSGVGAYAVQKKDFDEFANILNDLEDKGFIDAVVSIHMYPKELLVISGSTWDDTTICKRVVGVTHKRVTIPRESGTRKYTPRNNKLYCYPFNMLCASNNNGGTAVYKFERFNGDSDELTFDIIGGVTIDSGCKLIPKNYNIVGSVDNNEEGLLLSGFPSCAWDSDTYKIWLAQNQNQHALISSDANVKKAMSVAGGIGGMLGSIASGNVLGAYGSAVTSVAGYYQASYQIKSLVAQQNDMSITPPQAKGSFSPSLNIANGLQDFAFIYKRVSDENCKIIDDYLSMYGYKINRIQTPNINARERFTYIKTVGCIVKGNFNNNDKMKIASIFDNGITFWKNGDTIGTYYTWDNPCLTEG